MHSRGKGVSASIIFLAGVNSGNNSSDIFKSTVCSSTLGIFAHDCIKMMLAAKIVRYVKRQCLLIVFISSVISWHNAGYLEYITIS